MTERLLILFVVLGVALALVAIRERSGSKRGHIAPGINVVIGPGCRLCGPLTDALEAAGAEFVLLDIGDARVPSAVRSLPTVLVGDRVGQVILRRSGRSAISDLESILAASALPVTEGP